MRFILFFALIVKIFGFRLFRIGRQGSHNAGYSNGNLSGFAPEDEGSLPPHPDADPIVSLLVRKERGWGVSGV